jgi:hypothetical protein
MVSQAERRKDTIQVAVESAATHFGRIAGIVAEAVRDVTTEIGEFATDVFEMNEASKRAERDATTPGEDPLEEPAPPA